MEQVQSSELIYHGKVLGLKKDTVVLPNGVQALREVVLHPGGACILAIDDNDCVLLVKQYRYGAGRELLELPAGKLDAAEEPAACALRELAEETGFHAGKLIPLGEMYPSPAYLDEKIHLFYASELLPCATNPDEDEIITLHRIPFEEALSLALNGALPDAKTQAALFKCKLLRDLKLL